jgi:hypothetical protein
LESTDPNDQALGDGVGDIRGVFRSEQWIETYR